MIEEIQRLHARRRMSTSGRKFQTSGATLGNNGAIVGAEPVGAVTKSGSAASDFVGNVDRCAGRVRSRIWKPCDGVTGEKQRADQSPDQFHQAVISDPKHNAPVEYALKEI